MIDTKALKQKILDLAIHGKLVPQDPSDEPASVLLEKIRAEKQRLIKEGKIKKDKNESVIYKGDDNRYYENLPKGWVVCSISDILFVRTGATFNKDDSTTQRKENYIRVLRGGNISYYSTIFKNDDLYIPLEIVNENILVKQYDIITPAVTSLENIGKMSCIDFTLEERVTVGGFVYLLSPILYDNTFAKYIVYQLTSEYYINQLRRIAKKSGAAFYNINKTKLNSLPFFMPPYEEQKRIVEYIEKLLTQIDSIENNQTELKHLYDNLKNKTLDLAIRGKLVPQDPNDEPASVLLERIRNKKKAKLGKKYVDSYIYKGDDNCYYEHIDRNLYDKVIEVPFDLPEKWAWSKVGDIAFVTKLAGFEYSDYIAPNLQKEGVPLFKGKNIQNSKIIYDFEGYIPEHISNMLSRSQITKKCILTPYVGSVGNIGIHNKKGKYHLGSNVGKIELLYSGIAMEEFLVYYLKSMFGYLELTKHKKATAQESISIDAIRDIYIPLPPISEQQRIVDKLDEIFAKL